MRVSIALLGIAAASFYGFHAHFAPGAERSLSNPASGDRRADTSTYTPTYTVAQASPAGGTMTDAAPPRRVFSPQQPLITVPDQRSTTAPVATVQAAPVAPRKSDPFGETPVIQAVQPKAAAAPAPTPAKRSGAVRPDNTDARYRLAMDLQKELKRVGCYDGEINGVWGVTSKRAMTSFTARVNATLPIEDPDYILLALIQNHQGPACGACPPGQSYSNEGRCIAPRPVIAQQDRRGTSGPTPPAPSPAERAAAMASQLSTAAPVSRTARTWETGVFPAAPGAQGVPVGGPATAPAQVASQGPAHPAPSSIPAPFPGRMAVGTPPVSQQPGYGSAPAYAPSPYDAASEPAPPSGWQVGSLPPAATDVPAASPKPAAREPSRSSSSDRQRRNNTSLKTSQQVRDFFFGPGRASY